MSFDQHKEMRIEAAAKMAQEATNENVQFEMPTTFCDLLAIIMAQEARLEELERQMKSVGTWYQLHTDLSLHHLWPWIEPLEEASDE
jgi:hypothetical protein